MKATVEPVEGNKVKLTVEVDSETFEREVDAAFKRIAREVRIPGFRPGKAPRKLIEARIGIEAARGDAIEHSVPRFYSEAVRDNEVDVIAAPEFDLTSTVEDAHLAFEAVVEVRPTVNPAGYQSLRVTIDNPEIAIECHPAYMRESTYEQLADAGFNRMSIGIQDFNPAVLTASNRLPSLLPMKELFALLRKRQIRINLDFIYGLPLQTVKSFTHTIAQAIDLAPDRLVTFSYAHMPHLFPRQKLLERKGLPSEELKNNLYHAAQQLLLQGGYRQIGLDHYVKEEDELYRALSSGTLHRNFQGYCTRRTTGQVYAFGVTAISQLTGAYTQNTKSIDEYVKTIRNGHLPVKKGYTLNREEQVTREVITTLMCNGEIHWQDLAERLHLTREEVQAMTAYSEEKMRQFADDGLILFDSEQIVMREKGSPYVRNVAASLDKLLIHTNKTFSKPI